MRTYLGLGLGLALVGGAVAAPRLKDPPPKAGDIIGEWVCEERLIGGRPDPLARTAPSRFRIAADRWVNSDRSGPGSEADLELDPRARPPELTVYRGEAGRRTATLTGIYKLDGDTLTICYVLGPGPRPTAFESKAGTELRLMTLRRVRDATPAPDRAGGK